MRLSPSEPSWRKSFIGVPAPSSLHGIRIGRHSRRYRDWLSSPRTRSPRWPSIPRRKGIFAQLNRKRTLLSPAERAVASFPPVREAQGEYVKREPGRCATKANAVKPRCQWGVAALVSPAITDGRTGHDARAGGEGYQTAASIR